MRGRPKAAESPTPRRFWRSADGNIALTAALALPVALLFAGAAVDFQRWHGVRKQLQDFADMLALRGAKEIALSGVSTSEIEAAVRAAAVAGSAQMDIGAHTIDVVVDRQDASVSVTLRRPSPRTLLIAHVAPYGEMMTASATAVARGGRNVCVIATKETGDAIAAEGGAVVDASNCAILSNSTDQASITAKDRALLKAALICSAWGYEGGQNRFAPASPLTDCPKTADPLAERAPPPVGPCTNRDFEIGVPDAKPRPGAAPQSTTRLVPGVYCGGIRIRDLAEVVFDPGVYVIKDGPLVVGQNSTLSGDYVGFYVTGAGSTFKFEKQASVNFSAPKDGPMAGILFFEDRAAPLDRSHVILSDDARKLLGTIYLPRGALLVDTQMPVADNSAYTAIVVRRLEVKGRPTLAINANYDLSDVPVPAGLGPVGANVYLRN